MLIFFSSGSVYGDQNLGEPPFDEACPRNPRSIYAKAKAVAEDMILNDMRHGLEATILRVTNPYGFPQKEDRPQGVIPAFFHAAYKNKPFTLWGDGSSIKDYLYIEDLCSAVEKVIHFQIPGIFNLASAESVALLDLLKIMQHTIGVEVTIQQAPRAAWDIHHARYSAQRLREASGWIPAFSLMDGMLRYSNQWKTSLSSRK